MSWEERIKSVLFSCNHLKRWLKTIDEKEKSPKKAVSVCIEIINDNEGWNETIRVFQSNGPLQSLVEVIPTPILAETSK